MSDQSGSRIIGGWPEAAREAAKLVVDAYGEPDEATESMLVWHRPGPWKRIVATRAVFDPAFRPRTPTRSSR